MNSALDRYLRALDAVTNVVDHAPPDRWEIRSPCPDWSARQLLGHIIDGQAQVVAMLTGQGPRQPVTDLDELGRLASGHPVASWQRTQLATADALARVDPTASVATPIGESCATDMLAVALIEPLIHAWDLAIATGQQVTLDPEAVRGTLAAVQALGSQLADSGMYHSALAAPPDASAQAKLLAALGRSG